MNLEQYIINNLNQHTFEWFQDVQEEFLKHKLLRPGEHDYEGEKVLSYDVEEIDYIDGEGKLIIHDVSKTLFDYCWSNKTTDSFDSFFPDLKSTLDDITNKIGGVLELTGDINTKIAVLTISRKRIIRSIADFQATSQSKTYNRLLTFFVYKFRDHFDQLSIHLQWLSRINENLKTTPVKKLTTARARRKKKFTLKNIDGFFGELLNLIDCNENEIVDTDLKGRDKLVDAVLVPLCIGKPVIEDLQLNFNWESRYVCYILNRLSTQYQVDFKMNHIYENPQITVKGKPISRSSFRSNASRFNNSKSIDDIDLKKQIDEVFDGYTVA
jgi:hypothetical protein